MAYKNVVTLFQYEALTILIWQTVRKYLSKCTQTVDTGSSLQMPETFSHPIAAYFKSAVNMVQIPITGLGKSPAKRVSRPSAASKKQVSELGEYDYGYIFE